MNPALTFGIACTLYFLIASFVIREEVNPRNLSFTTFILGCLLWTATLYIYFFLPLGELLYPIGKLNYSVALLIPLGLLCFLYYFPQKAFLLPKNSIPLLVVSTTILFLITQFTPLIIENEIYGEEGPEVILGPIYDSYIIYWHVLILASVILGFIKYRKLKKLQKQNFACIFYVSSVCTLLMLFFNGVLPKFGIFIAQQYSFLLMLPIAVVSFYAFIKYQFLNIKLTISNNTKTFFALLISSGFVSFLYFHSAPFLNPSWEPTIFIFSIIVATFIYKEAIKFFNSDIFHAYFWITNEEYLKNIINNFKNQNKRYTSIETLEQELIESFSGKFKISPVKVVIFNKKNEKKYHSLINLFNTLGIHRIFYKKDKQLKLPKEASRLGTVIVPLSTPDHKVVGALILGKKILEDTYGNYELKLIESFRPYLNLQTTNILYNAALKKEVKEKTSQLEKKNKQLVTFSNKLKKLDAVKDEFLSIASHELRTPLSIIKGYADILRLQNFGNLNKKQLDFTDKILANTNDLVSLINKMLDISRLESGQMGFNNQKIDLVSSIKETQKAFKVMYKEKNLSLVFSNPEKLTPTVFLDNEKLGIIFSNLLGNAYKFSPKNKTVKIILESVEKEKKVKITIKDQGVGIPKNKQSLIFNKFQQAENPLQKAHAGSGLGLNITQQIIEKFGGKIWVKSEDHIKSGSAFIFTLPYTQKKSNSK